MRLRLRRAAWFVAAALCVGDAATIAAAGQSAVDGAASGRVLDSAGRIVPGARVLVESAAAGVSRSSTTGADGEFLVVRLDPAVYEVTVSAAGFETGMSQITVGAGDLARVEVRLAGGSAIVPIVEAMPAPVVVGVRQDQAVEAPAVHASESTMHEASDPRQGGVENATVPASVIDGVTDRQHFSGSRVGAGGDAGREAEEGGDTGTPSGVGGDGARGMSGRHAGAAYTFSSVAVREFDVRGGGYSALDGRAGVVTTVSKSGTNAVRGMAFYRVRDSAWAAVNPFSLATSYADGAITSSLVKPADLRQQFGGSLGGPVKVPRRLGEIFYFGVVDVQRREFPAVSSPGYAGFYALTATQEALLATRGVSAEKTNAALNYLNSLTGTVDRRADQQIAFGKIDWQATAKQRLSLQVNRSRWDSPAGVRSEPVVERGLASIGNEFGKVDAGVGRWLWLLNRSLSNEIRVAYGRDFEYETAQAPLAQEPRIGPGGLAPEVSIGPNGFQFGTPAALGRKAYPDERRLQAAEIVEWVHRRHLVQAGGEFSLIQDRIDALTNQEGTFRYDSALTNGKAGGLVDWITDYTFSAAAYPNGACPSIAAKDHLFCFRTFTQSFGQSAVRFDTRKYAGFAQDAWRITPGLNVTAGVRYEYEREPRPQTPNAALDALFGSRGATSSFPADRNNFGPRLGVAWEPLGVGRGTVRLGYGVYFGRMTGATVRAALVDTALPTSSASHGATHVRITPATETLCPQVANQGFGYGCDYVANPPAAVSATTSATVFDRRFRLPMVQHGSFELEREVGGGITATAAYVMNFDRQLPNSVDINILPSNDIREFELQGGPTRGTGPVGAKNGETFLLPFYSQRVTTLYGPVTDVVSNVNATYHAVELRARKLSRKGVEFDASWRWSKAVDYGEDTGATPRTNGQLDPFALGYDKGLSTLNFPHRVMVSAVWAPSVVSTRRWVMRAANGWEMAPLVEVVSGRAYSYEIFGGERLTGGHTSINGSGGADYLPTVGRNTLRLPESVHADLRVSRSMKLTEKVRLRAAAEVFNLPNHVNYTSTTTRAYLPGATVGGVTPLVFQDAATVATEGLNVQPFGAFTASSVANSRERQVQIGVRLEF
jgi:hypothetical protein